MNKYDPVNLNQKTAKFLEVFEMRSLFKAKISLFGKFGPGLVTTATL